MARRRKSPSSIHLIESAATELRLAAARTFVRAHAAAGVHLVGASRGAVDDLARAVARASGATIGLHRSSLTELAARIAMPELADEGRAPASALAAEAVAARAAFEAQQSGELTYFAPVAATPGFPRALARTLQELRLARVAAPALAALPLGGADLAVLLDRFEQEFTAASATDRASLFQTAAAALRRGGTVPGAASALLLLDVPMESPIEFAFIEALIESSPVVLITVPFGDVQALRRLESIGITAEVLDAAADAAPATDLVALRRYLFARSQPPLRERTGELRIFSAPGEGREAVEIARRILEEAAAGVPFDDMAVFVRSPEQYAGLLEQAFTRAGIPAWFDRGTERPHPAGRAFLALLACACDKLSARRFAEYLSLAQVPDAGALPPPFVVPDDEMLGTGPRARGPRRQGDRRGGAARASRRPG